MLSMAIGFSAFLLVVFALVVFTNIEYNRAIEKEERRERAKKILERKAARNRQELQDYDLFDKIERYRHDFDERSQAG